MGRRLSNTLLFLLLLLALGAYLSGARPFPLAEHGLLPWSGWVIALVGVNLVLWQRLMRVVTLGLGVIWGYAWLGNLIPQTTSEAPLAMGQIERTPAAFVEAGKAIFYGKGKCSTCHIIGEGATEPRCPDLAEFAFRGGQRKAGLSAKDYAVESLYLPAAYLVAGYGNMMPEAWKPPIALTPLEIETVVAFLQSQGGEADVSPIAPPVDVTAVEAAPPRPMRGDVAAGRLVFDLELQCSKCHRVGARGGAGGVGPDLTQIGALNTVEYIEESVLEPNAKIVKGYGWTSVRLSDGERLQGTVVSVDEESFTLKLEETQEEAQDWGWGDEEGATEGSDSAETKESGAPQERVIAKDLLEIGPIDSFADLTGEGYYWVRLAYGGGQTLSGALAAESASSFTVQVGDELVEVAKSQIESAAGRRLKVVSKMPRYDEVMTVRQFADLVTYLARLTGVEADTPSQPPGAGGQP